MSVSNALDTFRDRARTASPIGAHAKQGQVNLEITSTDLPTNVTPGSRMDGAVTFRIAQGRVSAFDNDYCIAGNLGAGVRVAVDIESAGRKLSTDRFCLPEGSGEPGETRTMTFSGTAPTKEGTHSITMEVRGANTGNRLFSKSWDVRVGGDTSGGFTPDDQDGDNGDSENFLDRLLKQVEAMGTGAALLAIGLLVVAVVL